MKLVSFNDMKLVSFQVIGETERYLTAKEKDQTKIIKLTNVFPCILAQPS